MAVLRNDRSGETVTTRHTNAEAAALFAQLHGANDGNWLWFWIHREVQRNAHRLTPAAKETATKTSKTIRLLADLFLVSQGYGLKRPMIRLHYRDRRFKLYLSQRGTLCLKSGGLVAEVHPTSQLVTKWTHDPEGDEEYMGCLLRGEFLPARNDATRVERPLLPTEAEFLRRLTDDPVRFMAECSRDMDRCCYCNLPLEDPRSKEAGYGATCARRWGLPWGSGKTRGEKVPAFTDVYDDAAAAMLEAIRESPKDEDRWAVFGDWLEERGLPRCEMPDWVRAART